VGVELVSEGRGTTAEFDHELTGNAAYKKYYRRLLKAEEKACQKSLGLWKDEQGEVPSSFWARLRKRLSR